MHTLTEIVKFYYGYDWCVKEVCGDRDSVFKPLQASLREHKIELDIRATDQKIPRADRMIRTIRDIFRTVKASLWYKIPQFLYPHFVEDTARIWNARPNSRTVDRSPREIVEGKKLEFDQHIKTPLGTIGEFYIPQGQRQHSSKEDRDVKKNEERTATGIVIGRNLDPTGTLEIYNIDTGTRANRCKVKLLRKPSTALKAQLRSLAPAREVVEDDVILPVPRITQSTKRSRNTTSRDAPLDPSHPSEVTDTVDSRGETKDASGPVVEQEEHSSTENDPDIPNVRSTEDSTTTEAPTEAIEKAGQSDVDQNTIEEQENDIVEEITKTQSHDYDEITTKSLPPSGSTSTTTSDSKLTHSDLDSRSDYPRRPGHRKLTRESNNRLPDSTNQPPEKVRSQRSNAGKQPQRYANLANESVELEAQFQDYVYSAADNLTIQQAKSKYPSDHKSSLIAELKQFHDMAVGKPIKEHPKGLKHDKVIGCHGFFKEVFDLRTGVLKKLKFRIVPHGHLLDRSLYEPKEVTSPTVSMESIFTIINVAAMENRKGFTMDIPGAYLNAKLKDKHVVRFPRDLAAEYIELYPECLSYLQ